MPESAEAKDNLEDQEALAIVMAFHARRLNEMATYEAVLSRVIQSNMTTARKDELSHERLLRQPLSYQVLTLVWQASPFSAGGADWDTWITDDTVYSLSKRLSLTEDERQRIANYITRVVEAAEFFDLVRREPGNGNKRLVKGTIVLHELMYEFARESIDEENRRTR